MSMLAAGASLFFKVMTGTFRSIFNVPRELRYWNNAVFVAALGVAAVCAVAILIERVRTPKPGWEYLTVTLAVFFVVITSIYLAWDVWDRSHPDISPPPGYELEKQPRQ